MWYSEPIRIPTNELVCDCLQLRFSRLSSLFLWILWWNGETRVLQGAWNWHPIRRYGRASASAVSEPWSSERCWSSAFPRHPQRPRSPEMPLEISSFPRWTAQCKACSETLHSRARPGGGSAMQNLRWVPIASKNPRQGKACHRCHCEGLKMLEAKCPATIHQHVIVKGKFI